MRTDRTADPDLTAGRLIGWTVAMLLGTLAVGWVCSLVGPSPPGPEPTWRIGELLASRIWVIRLFRLAAAAAVGAGLAVAGLALQALLRNPLAEPYILGLSSGAGVGVLLGSSLAGVALLPVWATTPVLAMAGALVTAGAVYRISLRRGRLEPFTLLLSGVIVNILCGALILLILQFVKRDEMIHFIGWGMGQIPEYLWFRPGLLAVSTGMILGGWLLLLGRGAAFNVLALGDEVAASSGVSVRRLRTETFLAVTLMTAAAVSLAGPVGFVGLIVPHAARLILGPDHRRLAVVAGFGGAMGLMVADTLCRLLGEVLRVGELPVGVVTALAGGPFFLLLLRRSLARREEP